MFNFQTKLTLESDYEKPSYTRRDISSSGDYNPYRSSLGGGFDAISANQKKLFNMKAQQPHRVRFFLIKIILISFKLQSIPA